MSKFQGKKVFITGGSSGIGKALAIQFVEQGASVAIAARGEARLNEAVAEIQRNASGAQKVIGIALDVADRDAVRSAAKRVLGADGLGGLDILINNAGIAHPGYVTEISDEIFDAMMNVNYFGAVNVTRAFLEHFAAQKSGHIVNVSSLLGFLGIFGYTAYAASKFAIAGFSDCLRQELLPHGVGISVVFPADVDTPQLHEENRIKPPETKAIAGTVKVMPPEAVAKEIISGIAARYHIVPGGGAKFTYFMHRHMPWMVRWVIDGDLKKYQKQQAKA